METRGLQQPPKLRHARVRERNTWHSCRDLADHGQRAQPGYVEVVCQSAKGGCDHDQEELLWELHLQTSDEQNGARPAASIEEGSVWKGVGEEVSASSHREQAVCTFCIHIVCKSFACKPCTRALPRAPSRAAHLRAELLVQRGDGDER
eukprot:3810034-Pleurochrysis_carterae.AAC.3